MELKGTGKMLITVMMTGGSSSNAYKYAKDCFIIQSFLHVDSSEMDDVFSKGIITPEVFEGRERNTKTSSYQYKSV